MQPTSLPVTPAQPDLKTYPFSALNLFVNFTRATFKKAFGHQAPAFDTAFPVKTWFDTRPMGKRKYLIIAGTDPAEVQPMDMSDGYARSCNLPGTYYYPPYAPSTTTTAVSSGSPVNTAILSNYNDALTLSAMLSGGDVPVVPTEDPEADLVTWNSETRRIWDVPALNGGNYNAGELLLQMWANGIGAPGNWDLSNVDNPVWVPAPPVDQYSRGIILTPVRPLLHNEVIQAGPAGIGYEIVRTDLP